MPVLFPVTDVTLSEVLKNRQRFGTGIKVPFSTHEKYAFLSDKYHLFSLAERLGVPVPRTIFPRILAGGTPVLENGERRQFGFPVVLKPALSRVFTQGEWIATSVRYANSDSALGRILEEDPFRSFPFILQERIEGPGVGIFLLMSDGEILAHFAHRRIREKPPSGGVSVLCESIEPPQDALNTAARLLKEVSWTGVAMVEFKQDRRDGVHRLIEVNARFWGSLQLPVSSGVDFPYLLYRMALGDFPRGPDKYRIGLRSRWELGDLDHLFIRMRRSPEFLSLPAGAPSRCEVLREEIADFFRPSVRNEVFRPGDPGPFLYEVSRYIRSALS
jgi:predicted ATP-grasp superfamily ATP-dependent carboligase